LQPFGASTAERDWVDHELILVHPARFYAAALLLLSTVISRPSLAWRSRTPFTNSAPKRCELLHAGSIVRDATYFLAAFMPFATFGICCGATGIGGEQELASNPHTYSRPLRKSTDMTNLGFVVVLLHNHFATIVHNHFKLDRDEAYLCQLSAAD
jgi:hypothetical protein